MMGEVTRRDALCLAGVSVFPPFPARASPEAFRDRNHAKAALRATRLWGCQYQNVSPDAITRSDLDLVVLEPSLDDAKRRFLTLGEIASMKRKPDGGRRIVLAYLSIGEADVKRWYWPTQWRASPPPWVGPANPVWPGARHVQFWHPEWQSLVCTGARSLLSMIVEMGFDGVLLDRVDAYGDWPLRRSGKDDMVALVAEVADRSRRTHPGFILVPQNAEHLVHYPRYLETIDGINKESLLTGLSGEGVNNQPPDVSWSLGHLRKAQAADVVTLGTEYMAEREEGLAVSTKLRDLGLLPFIAHRQLDRLPSTPGTW